MLRPILVSLAGVLCAAVPVYTGLPDVPSVLVFGLLVAGAVWGVLAWRKRRKLIGWLPLAVLLGYAAWFFGASRYPGSVAALEIGRLAPELSAVRVRDGAPFTLGAQRGHGVLLVFFRGAW